MIVTFQGRLRTLGVVIVTVAIALPCSAADHATAERSLMQGRIDEAVAQLHQLTAADPKDGAAHLLLCRAFYAEGSLDAAVTECESALSNGLANDSRAQDWMGRAYGRKADHAGPFTGLSLAHKVKTAFETAVQLDPTNPAAVNDLSEYYIGAPSIVGGGLDKAAALATRVEVRLPQSAHRMRAMAAERRKDYATAEREFRAAVAVANRPDAWTDLGDYFARRNQPDPSIAALRKALEADTAKDATLLDIALVLESLHREPQMAERVLREYLASNNKTDAAPAFKAHYQLGKLLAAAGNKAAAKSEYESALALALNFAPARKDLQAL
jgi:tetratricopeptide (TPR) repeat protein